VIEPVNIDLGEFLATWYGPADKDPTPLAHQRGGLGLQVVFEAREGPGRGASGDTRIDVPGPRGERVREPAGLR
jgi:hypothetical protein